MELPSTYFFVIVTIIALFIFLIDKGRSNAERLFIFITIGMTGYFMYLQFVKNNKSLKNTAQDIKSISSMNTAGSAVQTLFASDQPLLHAVQHISGLRTYDKSLPDHVVRDILDYYQLYSDILLGFKEIHHFLPNMVDLRFKVLRHLHQLHVSLPMLQDRDGLERDILVIQASTYKCMNVLKNKYDVHVEAPFPSNLLSEDTFDAY